MPGLFLELSALPISQAAEISGYLLVVFAAMQFTFASTLGGLSSYYSLRPVVVLAVLDLRPYYCLFAEFPVWA